MTFVLYKELSYKVQGALIEVRKILGPGHKELVYCNLVEEIFSRDGIKYKREKNIDIISPVSGKRIGYYKPDFIIDDKVILEVKAVDAIPKNFIDQVYSYLRVSNFELGIFVNFRSPNLYIKRVIFTNDRKVRNTEK